MLIMLSLNFDKITNANLKQNKYCRHISDITVNHLYEIFL